MVPCRRPRALSRAGDAAARVRRGHDDAEVQFVSGDYIDKAARTASSRSPMPTRATPSGPVRELRIRCDPLTEVGREDLLQGRREPVWRLARPRPAARHRRRHERDVLIGEPSRYSCFPAAARPTLSSVPAPWCAGPNPTNEWVPGTARQRRCQAPACDGFVAQHGCHSGQRSPVWRYEQVLLTRSSIRRARRARCDAGVGCRRPGRRDPAQVDTTIRNARRGSSPPMHESGDVSGSPPTSTVTSPDESSAAGQRAAASRRQPTP